METAMLKNRIVETLSLGKKETSEMEKFDSLNAHFGCMKDKAKASDEEAGRLVAQQINKKFKLQ